MPKKQSSDSRNSRVDNHSEVERILDLSSGLVQGDHESVDRELSDMVLLLLLRRDREVHIRMEGRK